MATQERPYLTLRELADRLGVSWETVRWWRKTGYGPPAHRFGQQLRFLLADVETWEATQREGVGS